MLNWLWLQAVHMLLATSGSALAMVLECIQPVLSHLGTLCPDVPPPRLCLNDQDPPIVTADRDWHSAMDVYRVHVTLAFGFAPVVV